MHFMFRHRRLEAGVPSCKECHSALLTEMLWPVFDEGYLRSVSGHVDL